MMSPVFTHYRGNAHFQNEQGRKCIGDLCRLETNWITGFEKLLCLDRNQRCSFQALLVVLS